MKLDLQTPEGQKAFAEAVADGAIVFASSETIGKIKAMAESCDLSLLSPGVKFQVSDWVNPGEIFCVKAPTTGCPTYECSPQQHLRDVMVGARTSSPLVFFPGVCQAPQGLCGIDIELNTDSHTGANADEHNKPGDADG